MAELRRTVTSSLWPTVLLIGATVIGALLGAGLVRGARFLPNDLQRTGVLLRALRAPDAQLGAVVFGDSVMMSGIDARIVRAEARRAGPVWNLSSTGQTLAESSLYYQELPSSVSTIVQAVRIPRLAALRDMPFNPHVANTFNINGYRASPETVGVLTRAFGAAAVAPLLAGPFDAAFESRWLVRQYIDTSFRQVVRSDLDASRALRDLEYPQPFTRALERDKLQLQIDQSRAADQCGSCAWRENYLEAIRELRAVCGRQHRRLVIVLSPVHPAMHDLYAPVFARLVSDIDAGIFGPPGDVVDTTRLLVADEFFDFQHPTPAGAAKLSRLVAERLGPR